MKLTRSHNMNMNHKIMKDYYILTQKIVKTNYTV